MKEVFARTLFVVLAGLLVPASADADPVYGLIQTPRFNEVTSYDLNQSGGFGLDATSVLPLNITNLLPQNSISSIAIQGNTLYGLIRTPSFNELTAYDLTQTGGFGLDASLVLPLNITNLLPQNSITSIAVQGNMLYGLIRTGSFNELIGYDLTQTGGFGLDASFVLPLNITNLLPQNSITSIAVQGNMLYGLITTPGFNELIGYDLTQTRGFGLDASFVLPLNITNLLPKNSITSIAVQGDTLYGLIRTDRFNELTSYDLTQTGGFGLDATDVLPLNITNLLPQNGIIAIAVPASTGTGGGTGPGGSGGGTVPEPSSIVLMMFGLTMVWRAKTKSRFRRGDCG